MARDRRSETRHERSRFLILVPAGYTRRIGDQPDPHDLMRSFPGDLMRVSPISMRVLEPIELTTDAYLARAAAS
jgi:hypothetical protein